MAAALLVGCWVWNDAEPVWAHEANPGVRVELDASATAIEGVDVAVVTSVTEQLVLANHTQDVVEILDDAGAPFLRIGPDGVHANLTSPSWYQTNNPFGLGQVPDEAQQGAEPRWAQVSAEPSWGWFDHRLHPADVTIPPAVIEEGEPAQLAQFEVPLRYRDQAVSLTGAIVYRPVRGSVLAELTQPPAAEGLSLAVLQGRVPGLFLDNGTGETVIVAGADGEPFLRFNRRGVQANEHSPSWLAARRAETGETADALIDPTLPPSWRPIAEVPRFGWLEPRAAYPDDEPPPEIIDRGEAATLLEWAVPITVGGRDASATGVTRWEPLEGAPAPAGGTLTRWLRPVAIFLAMIALAWLALRGRRRQPPPPRPTGPDPGHI